MKRMVVSAATLLGVLFSTPLAAHGDKPHETAAESSSAIVVEVEERSEPQANQIPAEVRQASPRIEPTAKTVIANLHPASVHFPIALILTAGIVELLSALRLLSGAEQTVRILLVFGAISAVIAAALGWFHTGLWLGGDPIMQWHRWTGTGIAAVSIGLCLLAGRDRNRERTLLRVLLGATCIAIILQGYWGAELAHGAGHLFKAH